jgi:hypothetical protein
MKHELLYLFRPDNRVMIDVLLERDCCLYLAVEKGPLPLFHRKASWYVPRRSGISLRLREQ